MESILKIIHINKVVRNDFEEQKFFMVKRMSFLIMTKLVIATHADEALKIIDNPTSDEELEY